MRVIKWCALLLGRPVELAHGMYSITILLVGLLQAQLLGASIQGSVSFPILRN